MELSQNQSMQLMKRFPEFELSYETISHKKVSPLYNICMAIPTGKKCFAWFTFHLDNDVCYLLDLNREKKVTKINIIPTNFDRSLSLETIVYGTFINEETTGNQWFIIEDIIFYKGIIMKKSNFCEKMAFLAELMSNIKQEFDTEKHVVFILPLIWTVKLNDNLLEYPTCIPSEINETIHYQVHHIQYRSCNEIMPYLNVNINKKINTGEQKKTSILYEQLKFRADFTKSQYKYPTVFHIVADIQFDIYHLFAFGKNNQPVYYNIAYIPNYKTSVFMNGLFRNIRENKNLDYIEESDDEDDFQNINIDKYVNVDKILLIECIFNNKFKKWTPLRLVDNRTKIVHVSKL